MTENEAAAILRRVYDAAPHRVKSTAVHLFGIKYARDLHGLSLKRIVEPSEIPGSRYNTEITKGRNLANYVEIVRSPRWL